PRRRSVVLAADACATSQASTPPIATPKATHITIAIISPAYCTAAAACAIAPPAGKSGIRFKFTVTNPLCSFLDLAFAFFQVADIALHFNDGVILQVVDAHLVRTHT